MLYSWMSFDFLVPVFFRFLAVYLAGVEASVLLVRVLVFV